MYGIHGTTSRIEHPRAPSSAPSGTSRTFNWLDDFPAFAHRAPSSAPSGPSEAPKPPQGLLEDPQLARQFPYFRGSGPLGSPLWPHKDPSASLKCPFRALKDPSRYPNLKQAQAKSGEIEQPLEKSTKTKETLATFTNIRQNQAKYIKHQAKSSAINSSAVKLKSRTAKLNNF